MKFAVFASLFLVSFVLFGCAALSGGPKPPIPSPEGMPSLPPMATPTMPSGPTATPAPSATPTPSNLSPAQAAAETCRTSFIEQLYYRYLPSYCSGMPPCTPKTEAELKAMITLDTRSAPIVGFTYVRGELCSVKTYFGRANFAVGECTLRDFTIDREATKMVPC